MTVRVQEISLQGFRAYLAKQSFDLRQGKSLAVFAPNARGKSSLVDAIDFFFSDSGTISKLGLKKSDTQAGPEALEHVAAEAKKIPPSVGLVFRKSPDKEQPAIRPIQRPAAVRPAIATAIRSGCKHDFVIRGHELRAFVEEHTPETRYSEVSKWFGLTPLVTAQKNLRTLRREVTKAVGDQSLLATRAKDVANATLGAVTSLEESDLLKWINDVLLAALDKSIRLVSLSEEDPGYLTLKERKKAEDDTIGVTGLEQLLLAISSIRDVKEETTLGRLVDFKTTVVALRSAIEAEAKERATAEKSVFSTVWEEAQRLLSDDSTQIADCPVCETPFEETRYGSRVAVSAGLTSRLALLTNYKAAADSLARAQMAATKAQTHLISAIDSLEKLLASGKFDDELAALQPFFGGLRSWTPSTALPDDAQALEVVRTLSLVVADRVKAIRERQGEATYAGAIVKIGELRRIAANIRLAKGEREELKKIGRALEESALRIDKEISAHIASLLDELRDEINNIFSKIQGPAGAAVTVGLEPPDPDAKGKLKLGLVIDFADNRKGVNPAGYLSDSQVHSIALSLRLAAIKLFNSSFPFIVLDDIVTSYDADHRKAVAAMIAEDFKDFQFVLVTHDERFYRYLKDHMPQNNWAFKQISHIEKDFGPRLVDHRVSDEVIEAKLAQGQHASNEIRQAEEEWLLRKAREFGISLRIRDIDKPYSYDRGEVASGLATFLNGVGIKTPVLPGFSNPLWTSLQSGEVENFGSHFQDNPNATGSVGDEAARWAEFKQFRDLFKCKCGSTRFKRPKVGVTRPLCYKCETPFEFIAPAPVAPPAQS